MPRRVKIAARAARQISEPACWWAESRPDAPGAIAADFAQTVALLARHPGVGAEYAGARIRGVRRLYLNRVGYFVYFTAGNEELHVLAFWHAARERQPDL
ncbi:MAG: type II toxin-antitoxin system RelE/ParE family toxin [Gammaproteobacteria bacterium]|nr:type II toxin-antitoxin system RelE/ParE family toxin [Gammaproteobacteria bacterium]